MEKFHINKKIVYFCSWAIIALFCGLGASLSGIYLYLSPNLPPIESLKDVELQTPLRVYSIDNKLIGEFGEKRRDPVNIDDTPQPLIDAILAAEDDAFYEHSGVSIKSLLRAAYELLLSGEIQTGGSTITMQVARNFFLSREQTFSRKFNEILLALKIEQTLTKPEILELYLNKIYLGNRAYGFKAAAQAYYGKGLQELTLAQLAMIAGLPKAPSTYNPIANPSRALIRRDWILKRMLSLGKITPEDYEPATEEPVTARYHGQNLDLNAPYIAEQAREKAIKLFGEAAYTNGYKIYTTVDSRLQATAQSAVVRGLLAYDNRHGYRGPEKQLDVSQLEQLNQQQTQENSNPTQPNEEKQADLIEQLDAVNLIPWLEVLKKTPAYGGLEPAAVIRIGKKSISVLTALGSTADVLWENGIKDARPFVNENFAGDPPISPDKVVKLGDIIRIYKNDKDEWHFSQIPDIEAALISIAPEDGAIRAMVGGFDFDHSSFNRVSQAKRQPGSNFKPFIYATGLENNMTPASIFNDAPIVVEDDRLENSWRPENASGKFYGPTRLRKALYLSRNLVSIRLLRTLGISKTIKSMERFGMNAQEIPRDLSMALGSYVMSPLDVATGYSVFANGGYKIQPYLIHHIRDRHDEVLYKTEPLTIPGKAPLLFTTENKTEENDAEDKEANSTPDTIGDTPIKPDQVIQQTITVALQSAEAEQVMDERIVYIMNSMLRDVVKRGTATRAQSLGRNDLAGKTGTTNGPTDAWFSGYNSHLVTTAWVGFDNNQKLGRGEYGGVAALPIWIEFMKTALEDAPQALPPQPDGIVTVRINPETGERAAPSDPTGIFEIFLEENAPTELDPNTITNGSNSNNPAPEELF
ncbi:MAG: penicillin-binding protein 1A [Cellvibrionaceae bacterium]